MDPTSSRPDAMRSDAGPPASHPDAPAARELRADPAWRAIDFISDLHLSEDTPRTFEAWRRYLLGTAADAVLILGDLFEAWIGDDARHEGFEARCAAVLKQTAARRWIGFMHGNRDFMVGAALLGDCGVHALPDPTVIDAFGRRILATHGDALCLADTEYQAFRRVVRDPAWQAAQLARPLEQRRALARQMRERSEGMHAQRAPADWVDVDADAAARWLAAARTDTMVHGHTHRPADERWPNGATRHVLSDWELDHGVSTPRAQVLRWQRDGLRRIAPDEALADAASAGSPRSTASPDDSGDAAPAARRARP
jgi:UDP-2,3-diacylglucosamine hydrolase